MSNSERLSILNSFIEVFEDFLDEKGIVIPNDEKEQSPESAANIYGTDYGNLRDDIEHLLVNLRNEFLKEFETAVRFYEEDDGSGDAGDAGECLYQNVLIAIRNVKRID